ncbi:MAG: GGDEF domain-containing protein [Fimbriimonas sp.]
MCLGAILLLHGMSGWHSALLPLYVLPVWVATHFDGLRSGAILVGLCAGAASFFHWKTGNANTIAEVIFSALLSSLTFGVMLVVMGWMRSLVNENKELAQRDPLTGLLNRRALTDLATRAIGRCLRDNQPLIVVAIDCDGFKQLNDTHGHKAGDHVLRILAGVLDKQTRDTDMVARTGGDEFLIVLRGVEAPVAKQILQRIESEFEHAVRVAGYECSVSMGMAVMEEESATIESLIDSADQAMYVGKERKKSKAYLN